MEPCAHWPICKYGTTGIVKSFCCKCCQIRPGSHGVRCAKQKPFEVGLEAKNRKLSREDLPPSWVNAVLPAEDFLILSTAGSHVLQLRCLLCNKWVGSPSEHGANEGTKEHMRKLKNYKPEDVKRKRDVEIQERPLLACLYRADHTPPTNANSATSSPSTTRGFSTSSPSTTGGFSTSSPSTTGGFSTSSPATTGTEPCSTAPWRRPPPMPPPQAKPIFAPSAIGRPPPAKAPPPRRDKRGDAWARGPPGAWVYVPYYW